jgi:hypothetical protein
LAVFAGDGHTGQSGGAPDRHCSLSGARHVSTPVGVWSDLTVGPVAPTCPVTTNFAALTSVAHCSSLFTFAVNHYRAVTVAPLAHRTCPVHTGQSGELWRSAPDRNPRVVCSLVREPGTPDTVKSFAPNLFVSPTEFLS